MTFLWRLLLSVLIIQLQCQTRVVWRDVCYTNITSLTENSIFVPPPHSPFKFPEVCNYPQKTFPNKAYSALVFSSMRLFCFDFFFPSFLLTWLTILGWCIKPGHEPHTHSHSPFTCLFFLSSSWILGPSCQFDVGISLFLCVNPTSFFTGLHFLLQATWTLTSCPVFSCSNSSGLVSYIDLADILSY